MILQITPIDTLFFRDSRPFEMGENTWANGVFPPLPTTFLGAIRTAYFSQYPALLPLANTEQDPTTSLRIRGFYLYKEMVLLPLLSELVSNKEAKEWVFFERHAMPSEEEIYSSTQVSLNPYPYEIEPPEGFMDTAILDDFIQDEQSQAREFVEHDQLLNREPKIGIGRQNATKTTATAKLYRVGLQRLEVKGDPNKKLSFLVDINLEALEENFVPQLLKLGGEGKLAKVERYEEDRLDFAQPKLGKCFKLAFLTPTIFKGGWLPDCFEYDEKQQAYTGTWHGVDLKLLGAFTGKPVPISGFDIKTRTPKTMYRALPAGSGYHFEVTDETPSEIIYEKFGNPED